MPAATEKMTLYEIVYKRAGKEDSTSAVLFFTTVLAQQRLSEAYHNPNSTVIFDSAEVRAKEVQLTTGEKSTLLDQKGWINRWDIAWIREAGGNRS
jgi:hypothetical protein